MSSTGMVRFLLFIFVGLFLCGCAEEQFEANTDLKQFQQVSQNIENAKAATERNIQKPSAAILATDDIGDYLLGPGDLLQVTVFETQDLNAEVRVSSRGIISLPLLGNVDVRNLTAAEAETKIEAELKVKYLQDPHVSIYIKEHVSKQITLVGSFKKPGTYDYVSKRKLLDVIAIAEGLSEKAGSAAYITRFDEKTKKNVNYFIDLDELVRRGNMEQNIVVMGGDVVFIPETGQCFVDGAVRKPGTYPLRNGMTITEVITLAGGLAGYADSDKIKLIRRVENGKERQVLSLSFNDLQGGVGDSLLIKDQDIIFAESSTSGTLFSGSGFTIGFLGTGVSFKDPTK
ncbi:MAG: polysaccharide export protein [Desulfocapsaceae bacterium]|nr:polysaccharide export protein [Desulfocapsaceae bacterium]